MARPDPTFAEFAWCSPAQPDGIALSVPLGKPLPLAGLGRSCEIEPRAGSGAHLCCRLWRFRRSHLRPPQQPVGPDARGPLSRGVIFASQPVSASQTPFNRSSPQVFCSGPCGPSGCNESEKPPHQRRTCWSGTLRSSTGSCRQRPFQSRSAQAPPTGYCRTRPRHWAAP
jgi:hypothetical protein